MLRPLVFCLAAIAFLFPSTSAASKRDPIADHFYLEWPGFFGNDVGLFTTLPDGSARKIGCLGFYRSDSPHHGAETQFAISADGRSIVFRSFTPFGKGADRVEAGIHRYSWGGRDTLLHALGELNPHYQEWDKAYPPDAMVFALRHAASPSARLCAVRSSGGEVPLVLLDASPLHVAAFYGRVTEIESLLGRGADPAVPNLLQMSALDVALYAGEDDAALCIIRGIRPDSTLFKKAMVWAVPLGRWNTVAGLIERGVDPNAAYDRWHTPLLGVIEDPFNPQIEQQIRQAFIPNVIEAFRPPESNPEGVRLLLDRGADPNGAGPEGLTPLHQLAYSPSSIDAVAARLLIERGADPSVADRKGRIPLHILVSNGAESRAPESMKSYLEGPFGALLELYVAHTRNLDCRDARGRTPVERALGYGNFIAAHYIVDHGATDTTVYYGHTVRQILADELKNRKGKKFEEFRWKFRKRYGVPDDANRE